MRSMLKSSLLGGLLWTGHTSAGHGVSKARVLPWFNLFHRRDALLAPDSTRRPRLNALKWLHQTLHDVFWGRSMVKLTLCLVCSGTMPSRPTRLPNIPLPTKKPASSSTSPPSAPPLPLYKTAHQPRRSLQTRAHRLHRLPPHPHYYRRYRPTVSKWPSITSKARQACFNTSTTTFSTLLPSTSAGTRSAAFRN